MSGASNGRQHANQRDAIKTSLWHHRTCARLARGGSMIALLPHLLYVHSRSADVGRRVFMYSHTHTGDVIYKVFSPYHYYNTYSRSIRIKHSYEAIMWSRTSTVYTIKKRDILFLTITLANLNQFLEYLYHFNREDILHSTVVKICHITWFMCTP